MASIQTLSDDDRRLVASWAADCAERVLPLFDGDDTGRAALTDAVGRTHAYAAGSRTAAEETALRMVAVKVAGTASTPAGAAAARAVAQASAVAHMGAHAFGAAGYAAKAVSLAEPGDAARVDVEIDWQLSRLTVDQCAVLATLPALGENSSGPLGPGLLTQGVVGSTIRILQERVAAR